MISHDLFVEVLIRRVDDNDDRANCRMVGKGLKRTFQNGFSAQLPVLFGHVPTGAFPPPGGNQNGSCSHVTVPCIAAVQQNR